MKKALSLSLLLSATATFWPSVAMEKQNVLINDLMALLSVGEKTPSDLDAKYRAAVKADDYNETLKTLHAGAHVDVSDENGNTALHDAMRNGNFKICDLLRSKEAWPSAQNLYGNFPIFYLNESMHLKEQIDLIEDIMQKMIHDQMFGDLLKTKIIQSPAEIKDYEKLRERFNETIGKKQEKYFVGSYNAFLQNVVKFIMAAIPNHPGDVVAVLHLDPSLPYRDPSLAQKKANHLITIIKVMNVTVLSFLKKPLTISKETYKKCFGDLAGLKKEDSTKLASVYLEKLKDIVDHPEQYKEEMEQQKTFASKDYEKMVR